MGAGFGDSRSESPTMLTTLGAACTSGCRAALAGTGWSGSARSWREGKVVVVFDDAALGFRGIHAFVITDFGSVLAGSAERWQRTFVEIVTEEVVEGEGLGEEGLFL